MTWNADAPFIRLHRCNFSGQFVCINELYALILLCILPPYPQLNERQERARRLAALEDTNRLRSASSARVTAAAFPLLSNLTRIHSKISKSKTNFWQDLQDQICLLGIHLLWESLKRTMNDSQTDYQFQWVKVSKCNICLAGACLHIHAQLSAHLEVTKTHRMNKIPLEPSASRDIQADHFFTCSVRFLFFFSISMTEGATWVKNDSGFFFIFFF